MKTKALMLVVGTAVVALVGCSSGTGSPGESPPGDGASTPAEDGPVYVWGDEDLVAADGARGSGCSPGEGSLPDGVWFGYVTSVGTSSVTVDLACVKGPDRGAQVVNDDGALRTVEVAPDACIARPLYSGDCGYDLDEFAVGPDSDHLGAWLFINDGTATGIEIIDPVLFSPEYGAHDDEVPGLTSLIFETAADGAMGSGCSPGAGSLPDGAWFAVDVTFAESSATFDLACFWDWDDITNEVSTLRTVPVAPDAWIYTLGAAGPTQPLYPWNADQSAQVTDVWLYVQEGSVVGIAVY